MERVDDPHFMEIVDNSDPLNGGSPYLGDGAVRAVLLRYLWVVILNNSFVTPCSLASLRAQPPLSHPLPRAQIQSPPLPQLRPIVNFSQKMES